MNQLEELFNERLANHSIPPPAGTWDRVAANLSKKNKTIAWVRWAAVLLIGTLTVIIVATRETAQVKVLSDTRKTPAMEQPAKQKEPVAVIASHEKKAERKVAKKSNVQVQKESVAAVADQAPEQISEIAQTEVADVTSEQSVAEPTQESKVASRSMVITYTLDPVVAVTPETPVAATDQKTSSLGKMVKFARDVKNGDSPIGLKVVKEDLFAHSKKKSPTKTH